MTDSTDIQYKDGFWVTYRIPSSALAQASGTYGVIFETPFACEIIWVGYNWETVASGGGNTMQLEVLTTNQSPGSGVEVFKTAIDIETTANFMITRQGYELKNQQVPVNGKIAMKSSGSLLNFGASCMTVYLKRLGKGDYR
jgi:hypothetical protein